MLLKFIPSTLLWELIPNIPNLFDISSALTCALTFLSGLGLPNMWSCTYLTAIHTKETSVFSYTGSQIQQLLALFLAQVAFLWHQPHTHMHWIIGLYPYLSPTSRMSPEKDFIVVIWSSALYIGGFLTHFPRFYSPCDVGSLRTLTALPDSPRNMTTMWGVQQIYTDCNPWAVELSSPCSNNISFFSRVLLLSSFLIK